MNSGLQTIDSARNEKGFVSDVLKLVSGTVVAQIVSLLAAPLLTRLFAPAAFGVVTLFVSISAIFGTVVCLRYDRSIIVPEADIEGFGLVVGSLLCTFLVTGISAVALWLAGPWLLRVLDAPDLHGCLWLVPVNVFILGILAAHNSWDTRKRRFGWITIAQVASSLAYVLIAITAGLLGRASGWFLIVGTAAGTAISAMLLCVQVWYECRPLLRQVSWQRVVQVLRRYHRFPKYSTGAALLNSISWELPTFFLSGFFSSVVVGQYALGNRLIRIPMSFLGINVSRVFSQRAAEAKYQGTLAPLVESTFRALVRLGLFPFLLLALTGRPLFSFVFGERWADAGTYSAILSLWAFFWFVSGPLASVLDILEEQALDLRINGIILVTRVISLLIGGFFHDPRVALGLFSASGVAVYGYFSLMVLGKCGMPTLSAIRILVSHVLQFLPYGAIVVGCEFFGARPFFMLLLSVALLLIYYLQMLRTDNEARQTLAGLFGKRSQVIPGVAN
jgi:lipopolysaccharide exporter